MATYTAIIGDCATIGTNFIDSGSPIANASPFGRRNPQLAAARIRSIQNPHIVSEAVGGLVSADFIIPSEEALRWKPFLRYGAATWLFDGGTPIFYGWAEQPVWTQSGDCQMTLSGPWALLGRSRMREAWELWDMSLLSRGIGAAENKSGQVNLNSDGTLTLSFPNGAVIALNDRVSVDYFLFGEAAFGSDDKLLTAFEFNITDSNNLTAAHRVRVFGKATPSTGSDQLYDTAANGSSGIQGARNLNGTNQGAAAWTQPSGYRCLRFQIQFTTGATTAQDTYATFGRIRVGTRESLFPAAGVGVDTAAMARDVLSFKAGSSVGSGSTSTDLPQEFWPAAVVASGTDGNSAPYLWGLDPRIPLSSAPNSGFGVTGFNSLEWQSPADILAALAALDGYHVGFYLPYNGRGGYDMPGQADATFVPLDVGSSWLSAPPQLYYQPFPDPVTAPDYTIHTREGAQVQPAADAQPSLSQLYVNFQTHRGRQESIITIDGNTRNYWYAQGFRRAEDYTVQPSLGDSTGPNTLGQQYLATRRNPFVSATITIENDGAVRYPILKQGCAITRLALIRPGAARIVDVAAGSGLRSGYATHIEWWGQTASSNERVELTLGQPGQFSRNRAHGANVQRVIRVRQRKL